jgi:hypothetical protein
MLPCLCGCVCACAVVQYRLCVHAIVHIQMQQVKQRCLSWKVCACCCLPKGWPPPCCCGIITCCVIIRCCLQIGKFAAADQLNLRHSQDPTALAAAPPAVTPHIADADDSRKDWAQQPVAARMLARIANIQLLSQVGRESHCWFLGATIVGLGEERIRFRTKANVLGRCYGCYG